MAFGCANVEVSITMPAISASASVPPARSSGRPRQTAISATISQAAAAAGSIQSPSSAESFEAWWSIVTRGNAANGPGFRRATSPTRLSLAQSASTSRS